MAETLIPELWQEILSYGDQKEFAGMVTVCKYFTGIYYSLITNYYFNGDSTNILTKHHNPTIVRSIIFESYKPFHQIDSTMINYLYVARFVNIETLIIDYSHVGNFGFKMIGNYFKKLRFLRARNCGSDKAIAELANLPVLERLIAGNIDSDIITDQVCKSVGQMTNLRILDLKVYQGVKILVDLLPEDRKYCIDKIGDGNLHCLINLNNLNDLNLGKKFYLTISGIRQLCNLPKLQRLAANGRLLDNESIVLLSTINFVSLRFDECHEISNIGKLADCKNLQMLETTGAMINKDDMLLLSTLEHLEELNLAFPAQSNKNNKITDEGFELFWKNRSSKKLKYLILCGHDIKNQFFSPEVNIIY